ncbi:MAG: hypothetical protein H0U65_11880 [Rubrobacter sp.]|nr:hypothetical protein [Rubrobacter sp.]
MENAETRSNTGFRSNVGAVGVGVIVLALATAVIHLYDFVAHGFLGTGEMLPLFQFLFVGNFLAYVILLGVLYSPVSSLASLRPFARAFLIAISVAAIASYFRVEVYGLLGNVDKVIEVLLIAVVTADAALSGDGFAGGGMRGALAQLGIGIALGVGMFLFLSLFIGNN